MFRIGLISDTHGLLRPEARAYLEGSDHIVHGGDIGSEAILTELASIAPITVVRGNNDREAWAGSIPETQLIELGGLFLYAIHDLAGMDIDPDAVGVRIVMSGHSHKPLVEERGGVIYVNPGSAGPRRFTLPISAGEITIDGVVVSARTVVLV